MLYPVVPHLTHRFWIEMGYSNQGGLILDAPWPIVDEAALVKTEIDHWYCRLMASCAAQLRVAADATKEANRGHCTTKRASLLKALNGGSPKKVIVVPGRLVNIVV